MWQEFSQYLIKIIYEMDTTRKICSILKQELHALLIKVNGN